MKNPEYTLTNVLLEKQNTRQTFIMRYPNRLKHAYTQKILSTAKTCIGITCALLGTMVVTASAGAENIVYDGTSGTLRNMPSGYGITIANVLYPGTGTPSESNNTVTVNYATGTAPSYVFGGLVNATVGTYGGNTVNVNNGTVDVVRGIYSSNRVDADAAYIILENNQVYVRSGAIVTGQVYGAYVKAGIAQNNQIYIEGGDIARPVIGAYIEQSSGSALNNTVEVSGGIIRSNIVAGMVDSGATSHKAGHTNYNTVRISGGEIYGNWVHNDVPGIIGGYSFSDGNANGNTVEISGSPVIHTSTKNGSNDSIFWIAGGVSFDAEATNNTVTISGTPELRIPSGGSNLLVISGGVLGNNTHDGFTGNTLNYAAHPITVYTVQNFEHYNFTLDPSLANTTSALITAEDISLGDGAGTPSTIKVVGIHSGAVLNAGDEFVLMQATSSMTGDGVGVHSTGIAQQGISLLYEVKTEVNIAGKQATATILGNDDPGPGPGPGPAAKINPQLKALSEGYLSGLMLVNRGADAIAFDAPKAISAQHPEQGLAPFALMSAGHTRYNSGSHIKSNDFLLMGGLAYRNNNITAGVFIEGGWGSYDSYNSFYNAANVHGDGHNRYTGVGLLGRYDFTNGLYTDASIRFGESRTKFDTTDIQNFATGQYASYNLKSSYASAHVGLGYVVPINEANSVDLSAKYLWSGVGGKSVTVAGDAIRFERMNSHRVRLNAELNHQYSSSLTLNAGVGYEHEFDGKAKATTYHTYDIEAPSVQGGTGILSLGATIKPTSNQNLSLNIKAGGYAGKREGVRGSLVINYAF